MPDRLTKNISLTADHARFIDSRIQSGRYQSASEVVRAGLRLLQEEEAKRLADLEGIRKQIAIGLEQAERGDLIDGGQVFKQLRRKLRKKANSGG